MYVAGELYKKCVPGLKGTECVRNVFTHVSGCFVGSPARMGASIWLPVFIRSRSRTRIARRLTDGSAGASSGKNLSTGSSRFSFPSATAKPTAVEVKLLLKE